MVGGVTATRGNHILMGGVATKREGIVACRGGVIAAHGWLVGRGQQGLLIERVITVGG